MVVASSLSTGVATATHLSTRTSKASNIYGGGGGTRSFSPKYFKKQRKVSFMVRSSDGGGSSEVSSATTEEANVTGEAGEEAMEESEQQLDSIPTGPPSLISALNVEKALRGIAITDVDHYGRLGLQRGCSYDQVSIAYKSKVEELMKGGLPEEQLQTNLDELKESYSILSCVEERRLYDWSLARTENRDRYKWPFEVDITQTPRGGTPPSQEPEDVGPTRLVGYFILGSFVLSVILSITLNQQ